ncbi:hypothetical protein GQ55_1G038500 [Panicum hallii var. hallii]|uniref:Leucine-rich repeat-containing N-terminal plant-type domain-containing protein n=1 Tax=Panicum hallii var. hallii TaxID=1504633 RepID=A0A2T7F203_9POAL|nr:hypothetical protein GQ55_1G038500 [Panicum hallii var. hallii]
MAPFGPALLILLYLASLATSCTEQERSSLLQFITELSYDSGLSGSWENTKDCCKWEGITCGSDMTVTDVFLTSSSLQGTSPRPLATSPACCNLNLSHNFLSGSLPMELVSSKSIVILDVSFNQLNGDLQELQSSSPVSFLQVLNISSDLFTGRFPSTTWEVMKSLVVLNASNNSFTGYNQFSGSIPPELTNCSTLKSLHAGHNKLGGTLQDELFNITSLAHLFLHNNQFEGSLIGIGNLTNLVTLDLGGNALRGNIPEPIGELKRLEELHLDDNSMSGELPSTLSKCKNLIIIDLKSNDFSGELAKVSFSKIPNLKILDVVWNNFSGTVPESIYSCSNLTALRLSSNRFHGQLSERIDNLKSLSFLSIVNNSVTNITRALQILRSCRNLTTLLIGKNFMDEAMPEDDTFNGFENLQCFPKTLNLGNNNLTGVMPKEIGRLKALLSLNLSSNKLTGAIPQSICDLTNLQKVDLSGNHLTGAIPTSVKNLHFLSQFNISSNDLEGPIPFVGQLSTFPTSSFDGNPELCGPMIAHHCDSAETILSKKQTAEKEEKDEKAIFVIAFGAFFCVGVLYDLFELC